MLRNNPIGSVLVSIFFLLALTACWLSVRYYFSVKEAQAMQFRIQTIEGTMTAMQRLVAEAVEFSKKNPDLDPILLRFSLKPAPPATNAIPAAARPAR
ncbi:MAG: hypothetical protein QOF48_1832 [Verrucomicrobiota bacterium]